MNTLSVRKLTKQWAQVNKTLKPGECVPVTSDGKVVGHYTKAGSLKVDWRKLRPVGSKREGDKLIKKLLRGL